MGDEGLRAGDEADSAEAKGWDEDARKTIGDGKMRTRLSARQTDSCEEALIGCLSPDACSGSGTGLLLRVRGLVSNEGGENEGIVAPPLQIDDGSSSSPSLVSKVKIGSKSVRSLAFGRSSEAGWSVVLLNSVALRRAASKHRRFLEMLGGGNDDEKTPGH